MRILTMLLDLAAVGGATHLVMMLGFALFFLTGSIVGAVRTIVTGDWSGVVAFAALALVMLWAARRALRELKQFHDALPSSGDTD